MSLRIKILTPSTPFEPYINYYKYIEGFIEGEYKIVPAVNQEIYFHLNPGNYIFSSPGLYKLDHPLIHFMGLHECNQDVFSNIPKNDLIRGFVIVFKPNGITKLFKLSHSEIFRYSINGENIFRNYTEHIWYQLQVARNFHVMKKRLEDFLLKFVNDDKQDATLINDILNTIKDKKGMLRFGQLCSDFHISPRTLQRTFKNEIGMSAKEFMQITRLNYSLFLMQLGQYKSLTELSYLSGYYDQSHFIRDIKSKFGFAPGNISNRGNRLNKCDNRLFLDVTET